MVYKGRVIKEEKNYIIVLTKDCQYKKIRKKGQSQLGKEIIFLDEDIINKSTVRYGLVAAILLLIVTTAMFAGINFGLINELNTYSVVGLDINPSIEFRIDDQGIVRKVTALDEEGKDLVNKQMIGMEIKGAVTLGINNAIDKKYLTSDNDTILISQVNLKDSDNINIKNSVIQSIQETTDVQNVNLVYIESDKESFKEAEKNNMTAGKYEIYKKVAQNDDNVSIKSIKDMKVAEIAQNHEEIITTLKVTDFDEKQQSDKNSNNENDEDNNSDKDEKHNKNKEKNQANNKDRLKNNFEDEDRDDDDIEHEMSEQKRNNKNQDKDYDQEDDKYEEDDEDDNKERNKQKGKNKRYKKYKCNVRNKDDDEDDEYYENDEDKDNEDNRDDEDKDDEDDRDNDDKDDEDDRDDKDKDYEDNRDD